MELFTVACTTCKARLKVRDGAAIGQILACPKCGSMVEVSPPAGWRPLEEKAPVAAPVAVAAGASDAPNPPEAAASSSNRGTLIALVAAPIVTLAIVAGMWALFGRTEPEPQTVQAPLPAIAVVKDPSPVNESSGAEPADAAPAADASPPDSHEQSALRFAPTDAAVIVDVRLNSDLKQDLLLTRRSAWLDPFVPLIERIGGSRDSVRRILWVGRTGPTETSSNGVAIPLNATRDALAVGWAIIEFDKPLPEFAVVDQPPAPAGFAWQSSEARLDSEAWPHPFVVMDGRFVVIAPREQFDAAPQPATPDSDLVELLEKQADASSAICFAMDLRPLALTSAAAIFANEDFSRLRERARLVMLEAVESDAVAIDIVIVCDDQESATATAKAVRSLLGTLQFTATNTEIVVKTFTTAGFDEKTAASATEIVHSAASVSQGFQVETKGPVVRVKTKWSDQITNVFDQASALRAAPKAAEEVVSSEAPDVSPAEPAPVAEAEPEAVARAADLPLEPLKPRPPEVVASLLDAPLPGIAIRETPLCDAISLFQNFTTLSITIDVPSLSSSRIDLQRPVSFAAQNTTVRDALAKFLTQEKLAFHVEGDQLIVASAEPINTTPADARYEIGDLTKGDLSRAEQVASLLSRLTGDASDEPKITAKAESLSVHASATTQAQVRKALEALRGKKDDSSSTTNPWSATISANFLPSASLHEIVDHFSGKTGGRALFDYASLAKSGRSGETQVALAVSSMPAELALALVLEPLDLGYVRFGDGVIQITSATEASREFEVQIYSANDFKLEADALASRLKEFESRFPREFAGENQARCLFLFDDASSQWLVRASTSTHALLRAFLLATEAGAKK